MSVGCVIFVSSHLLYTPASLFISISLDTIVLPSTIWMASLSQMRQQFCQADICSQTTDQEDRSVPAKTFTYASVRLCCYLQSNLTQGPRAKLALNKPFIKIQQNRSKCSCIAFQRCCWWELAIMPTLIMCFCQEMIRRTAMRENLLKPTRFFSSSKAAWARSN